jgi:hypothetical protein
VRLSVKMQARVFKTFSPFRNYSCPFRPAAFSTSKKPSVSSRVSGLMTLNNSKFRRSTDLRNEKTLWVFEVRQVVRPGGREEIHQNFFE